MPYYRVANVIHSAVIFASFSPFKWGFDALRSLTTHNAGGASYFSEAASIWYFTAIYEMKFVLLEMEIPYERKHNRPIVDFAGVLNGARVGVSVTRAFNFFGGEYTPASARNLMGKKLNGLSKAMANGGFEVGILHIWVPNNDIATKCAAAIRIVRNDHQINDSHIVLITICDEKKLYYEKQGDPISAAKETMLVSCL